MKSRQVWETDAVQTDSKSFKNFKRCCILLLTTSKVPDGNELTDLFFRGGVCTTESDISESEIGDLGEQMREHSEALSFVLLTELSLEGVQCCNP